MTLSKLSEQGHTADALAPRADEGRGKLRKGMGRSKHPVIHAYPNGATTISHVMVRKRQTWGTETSKYPEEK